MFAQSVNHVGLDTSPFPTGWGVPPPGSWVCPAALLHLPPPGQVDHAVGHVVQLAEEFARALAVLQKLDGRQLALVLDVAQALAERPGDG